MYILSFVLYVALPETCSFYGRSVGTVIKLFQVQCSRTGVHPAMPRLPTAYIDVGILSSFIVPLEPSDVLHAELIKERPFSQRVQEETTCQKMTFRGEEQNCCHLVE